MSKKGFLNVDWEALGGFALDVATGDVGGAVQRLASAPTEPAPPLERHAPNSAACEMRADGFHCVGHNGDGDCIMAKDA